MGFPKCVICTDRRLKAVTGDTIPSPLGIPDADTNAPVLQTFNINGQQVQVPVVLPVCLRCRHTHLKPLSRTGLIT